jgi:hypothetical protein
MGRCVDSQSCNVEHLLENFQLSVQVDGCRGRWFERGESKSWLRIGLATGTSYVDDLVYNLRNTYRFSVNSNLVGRLQTYRPNNSQHRPAPSDRRARVHPIAVA